MGNDIKLLGLVAAALFFCMAIMLLLTLRQAGRVRGASDWLWGTVVLGVATALNTLQESIAPMLGLVLSNALLITGAAMSARGSFEYRYHRIIAMRWGYALLAFIVAALIYFVYVQPHAGARILIIAITVGATCAWHAWVLCAGSAIRPRAVGVIHTRFQLAHGIMVLGLLMMVMVFALRAIDTANSMQSPIPPGGSLRTVFLFYAIGLAGRMLVLIGMVLVLIDELDYALRMLASRDPLTGLLNRRGFMDEAGRLMPLVNCSLLMLDLDHFKSVNDDFGHEQGDRAIVLLADCAQEALPSNAVIARFGGEEFCALLPTTEHAVATATAEKLRAMFHQKSMTLGHKRAHTVSIGVASQSAKLMTLTKLIEQADAGLYQAKREGRNRIGEKVMA